MKKGIATLAALLLLCSSAACTDDPDGEGAQPGNQSPEPSPTPTYDLSSWDGIASALDCSYASEPVVDKELGQERSNCESNDDSSKYVTVIKAEDPQATEAAFTTYQQPYTFVSENWALVGELDVLKEAAEKLGTEVHGTPGEGVDTTPMGEPFSFQRLWHEIDGTTHRGDTKWQITLTDAECGLTVIESGVINYETTGPDYLDAKPEPGNEFCMLTWEWANVGKKPDRIGPSGNIMVDDLEFQKLPDDEETSSTATHTHLDASADADVNPGSTVQRLDVYQIPEGEQATAVWFPESDGLEELFTLVTIS